MAALFWFRKSLRLHDNPALLRSINDCKSLLPLFIIDPYFRSSGKCGALRYNFLMQSLLELNRELESVGSRLVLLEGSPLEVLQKILPHFKVLAFEKDTEPYSVARDEAVRALCDKIGVDVVATSGHTLHDMDMLRKKSPTPPTTYGGFEKLVSTLGAPPLPLDAPTKLPPLPKFDFLADAVPSEHWLERWALPLQEGQKLVLEAGEKAALKKMVHYCADKVRVAKFSKPETDPTKAWYGINGKIEPGATTVLSPYLKFGSLSCRSFYWALIEAKKHSGVKDQTSPPVSLVGQLLWREFFYFVGYSTRNFDRMEGNSLCKQIGWKENEELFLAWKTGRTGFPWIDAIMHQLRNEGWIHHLARHCVACFLTREKFLSGDLYISWEKGQGVFEELLLDADWSLNAANWMWLSCSAFFSQYWKVYSPVSFGKKYDKSGEYIRKHLPELKLVPEKYIYEPWLMSVAEKKKYKCENYPAPICDHSVASKECIAAFKKFYGDSKNAK